MKNELTTRVVSSTENHSVTNIRAHTIPEYDHNTSIAPHSKTLNRLSSPAPASTPTTFAQSTCPTRARAPLHIDLSASSADTPRKSINTRVTTSGLGVTSRLAVRSYVRWGRNRRATIQDVLEDKQMELVKVHMTENPADLLTKGLLGESFAHCRELMGVG